jgi:hypothetical protein
MVKVRVCHYCCALWDWFVEFFDTIHFVFWTDGMKGNATMAILPILVTESCNMSADHTAHLTKQLTNLLPYCLLRQKKAQVKEDNEESFDKQNPNNQDNQEQDVLTLALNMA